MKIINGFFKINFLIEDFFDKMEDWFKSKEKYWIAIAFLVIVLGVVLIIYGIKILGSIMLILGVIMFFYNKIIGWRTSVRKWLIVGVVYNVLFSITIAEMVDSTIANSVFIIAYILVWLFMSLVSSMKVALLANEIVSGIATTIFTIGTYLLSIALKNMPSSDDYILFFQTDEIFESALEKNDTLAWKFLRIMGLEVVENIFLLFLPIIAVTAISMIMLKIKDYWIKKMLV